MTNQLYAEISSYYDRAHQFNDTEAVKQLESLVSEEKEGFQLAASFLVIIYYYGFSCVKRKEKAETLANLHSAWLIEVCGHETHDTHPYSTYTLAVCYYHGLGVEKNIVTYIEILNRSVDMNYSPALAALGYRYDIGDGVPQSYEKALALFHRAGENGFAQGYFYIGEYYRDGLSVPVDHTTALKYFHKAAELGSGIALDEIGACYLNGIGVDIDEVEAVVWYRKAAEKGLDYSQQTLGYLYWVGRGVPAVDLNEAMFWIEKSAAQGNTSAKLSKATYLLGCADGVIKDTDVAFKLTEEVHTIPEEESREQAIYARACNLLGHCYFNGYGCDVDEKKALDLLSDAVTYGDDVFGITPVDKLFPSACRLSHAGMILNFIKANYVPVMYLKDRTQMNNCVHVLAEYGHDLKFTASHIYPIQELFELDEHVAIYYPSFTDMYHDVSPESLQVVRLILESGADYMDEYAPPLYLKLLPLIFEDSEEQVMKLDLWFAYQEMGLNVLIASEDGAGDDISGTSSPQMEDIEEAINHHHLEENEFELFD